jgi:hypothetical protein
VSTKDIRQWKAVIEEELLSGGVKDWEFGRTKRHPCVSYVVVGIRCRHTFPGSASDVRAIKNMRTQIRNTIREARSRG